MDLTDRTNAQTEVSDTEAVVGQKSLQRMKRADPPVPPTLSRTALREAKDQAVYHAAREVLERRSVFRGLIFLVILIALFAVLHGGAGRAFPPGWWRQW